MLIIYDTVLHRYHDNVTNISKLVAAATESVRKRDSLSRHSEAVRH